MAQNKKKTVIIQPFDHDLDPTKDDPRLNGLGVGDWTKGAVPPHIKNLLVRANYQTNFTKDGEGKYGKMKEFSPEELADLNDFFEAQSKAYSLRNLAKATFPKNANPEDIERLKKLIPDAQRIEQAEFVRTATEGQNVYELQLKGYIETPEELAILDNILDPMTVLKPFPAWDPNGQFLGTATWDAIFKERKVIYQKEESKAWGLIGRFLEVAPNGALGEDDGSKYPGATAEQIAIKKEIFKRLLPGAGEKFLTDIFAGTGKDPITGEALKRGKPNLSALATKLGY